MNTNPRLFDVHKDQKKVSLYINSHVVRCWYILLAQMQACAGNTSMSFTTNWCIRIVVCQMDMPVTSSLLL